MKLRGRPGEDCHTVDDINPASLEGFLSDAPDDVRFTLAESLEVKP